MIERLRTKAGMRQRELQDFRTPQHPSLGTNNWGGASPLLARNIPKEPLEMRYLRLNTIRTGDEIFPAQPDTYASIHEYATPTPSRSSRKGFLSKLKFPWKRKLIVLDLNPKKRRLFPGGRASGILKIVGLKVGVNSFYAYKRLAVKKKLQVMESNHVL